MRRRHLLIATAGTLAAACVPAAAPGSGPGGTVRPPLAANPVAGIWPRVVEAAPAVVRGAYAFAAANEDTLRWIPCYCGCDAQGHVSNFDCYVAEVGTDGWMVLDTHGLG